MIKVHHDARLVPPETYEVDITNDDDEFAVPKEYLARRRFCPMQYRFLQAVINHGCGRIIYNYKNGSLKIRIFRNKMDVMRKVRVIFSAKEIE